MVNNFISEYIKTYLTDSLYDPKNPQIKGSNNKN